MYQYIGHRKESAKSIKDSFSHQKNSIKDPIVKKPGTKALILDLFFQNFKAKKSLKTWDLGDKSFYDNKPFM